MLRPYRLVNCNKGITIALKTMLYVLIGILFSLLVALAVRNAANRILG
ncbi:MAG TPA: hypothetical protein VI564_07420 [Candidatus Nanoarchaeia archaeon]|nr:hypothetical protein [Candidatus Nanoarchaeia archaeon]